MPLVRLESWREGDLDLLRGVNAPEMTSHLGGPENEEQMLRRHERYLASAGNGTGGMFSIHLLPALEAVGTIGYWEHAWHGETVYETGWSVLPAFQGRGIARAAAAAVVDRARAERKHRHLHAYPSVANVPSNAVCRSLGFAFMGECDFEYPVGNMMHCNDWRLALLPDGDSPDP